VGGRVLGVHGLEMELVFAELAAVLAAVLEPLQEAFLVRVTNAPRALARMKQDSMTLPANAALLFVVIFQWRWRLLLLVPCGATWWCRHPAVVVVLHLTSAGRREGGV